MGNDSRPQFGFSLSEAGSFQCRIDGQAFGPCSGTGTHRPPASLGDGLHSFHVRAIDLAGNRSDPADVSFRVDTEGPTVTILGPAKLNTRRKKARATFTFFALEPASYRCALDGGGFDLCSSPLVTPKLARGKQTLEIEATGRAGNSTRAAAGLRIVRGR